MKVFISWSGKRSKELANSLREWLPMVLQYVEPFVSDKDISAGDRWAQAIAGELESSNFGIICITPENIDSEWILFETGALSKSMLDGKVIPLLFGLELSDLSGPLAQFQAQKVDESGIMEVIKSINKVADNKASEQIVDQLVPTLWPQLDETLSNISDIAPSEKFKRPTHEILEELVTGVRGINTRMRDMDPEISNTRRPFKHERMHMRMMEEISSISGDLDDPLAGLLLLAGLLREYYPWLSELLLEAYREIRVGGKMDAEQTIQQLSRTVTQILHHPMARELSDSKEAFMMLRELPMMLDMTFHRMLSKQTLRTPFDINENDD